ncbi:MAG TPA: FAD-dependent oxidoreductase [Bacteroidales bacterium]|nr:FAD-dependent oxidoreductase [Bacteroidales bacterium]
MIASCRKIELLSGLICIILFASCSGKRQFVFLEAESFINKGGWVVDQQFIDVMGSPYLMAHGLGKPVADAVTTVKIPCKGSYRIWVRTKNWTAPFTDSPAPGIFTIAVNGIEMPYIFGRGSGEWQWEAGGQVSLNKGDSKIAIKDLTGFNGRIDAIIISNDHKLIPSDSLPLLNEKRRKWLGLPDEAPLAGSYDLVVAGGGIAGISTAVSAARLGLKVALIQNRPVLGGNNSSEIRVWRSGKTQRGTYPALGRLVNGLGPDKEENMKDGESFSDGLKETLVTSEKNIALFLNYHIFRAITNGNKIVSVIAQHIENGSELRFEAPLFADCTGDANLGFIAGADYREGSENQAQTGESKAPVNDTLQVLGATLFWWSGDKGEPNSFPDCPWAMQVNEESCQYVLQSSWNWESGFSKNMISDLEEIRDNQLRAIFGNWDFQKNKSVRKAEYKNFEIAELGYIIGKRESRRLLGDLIITQHDLDNQVVYPDGCVEVDWGVDIHVPDPVSTKYFPGMEFRAIAIHQGKETSPPFLVPYRCFYSRNISNLFMAGRHISATHVAHAATRVQRYTGTYGEVVGIAASLCMKFNTSPRGLYETYLPEFKEALNKGVPLEDHSN